MFRKCLENEKSEGDRLRAREEKILNDERSSRHFYNKKKRIGESKQISTFKVSENTYGKNSK